MELVGEEKRIQALFSEVRFADEQTAPSFVGMWNRAQAKTTRTQRAFNLSFVAATALLVCALVSLAWWVNRAQRSQQGVVANVPPITNVGPKNVVQPLLKAVVEFTPVPQPHSGDRSRALKLVARRQAVLMAANRKAARDAKAIESWQSPTATLLDSSSDELLKSLPQLNQTVDELKSFLPVQPK
jgi:Na+/phosphate symporter